MKSNCTNRFLGSLRRFFTTSTIVMSGFGLAHAAGNTWTGAASTSWDTTSANWDSPTTWTNGDSAVFNPGAGTVTVTEDITISGLTITGAADRIAIGSGNTLLLDYAAAIPAPTGGWATMIEGPGTLRLNSAQPVNGSADWGPNSAAALPFIAEFTGTLIVDNGRMDSSPAGLGGISEITINNGGQFLGWTGTYLQPFTLSGDGWGEGGYPGALRAAAGNNCVFSADITLAGDAGILSQDGNSVVIFDGSVGGAGSLTLHTRGQFNFNGLASESYSGSLRINTTGGNQNNSTITFNKPAGMVAVPDNATVDFGYGTLNGQVNLRTAASDQFGAGVVMHFNNPWGEWSRFDLVGTNQTLVGITSGDFNTTGGGVIQNGGIGIGAVGEATLTLNGSGDYLFNGHMRNQDNVASGAFNLVKNGTGTQTLVGSVVTHTGLTTVNDGTLIFAKTNALNTSIENNATVEINSVSGDDWILNNGKTLSGAGTWNKTGGGRASFMNTTVLTTGQFNIQEGTLRNNNNFGNWTNSTASFDISSGAILDLFADAIYLDKLTGSGIVQNDYGNGSPNQTGASAFIEKLVVGVADGSSTFSGILRNNGGANVPANGTAGGGLELHKMGTGTLTLTGSLTYTGITNLDDGILEIASPTNNTLAGAISGTGALVKANTGRLTLAGVNPYSGPTTVNGGVLTLSGTAPNTEITVNTGAGLGVNATGKTLSLVSLAGNNSLELPAVAAQTTTVGTLDLTATPALTVKPFFAAAPLVGSYDLLTATSLFGTAGAITTDFGLYDNARGVAGTTALSGGKLVLTVTGTFTGAANLVWTNRGGAGTGKWSAAIPADNNFSNGGSPDSFYDLDHVAFNGAAPGTINLTGPLFPGSIIVDSSTGDYTFAGPGSIGGPTGLVKSGSSALTINTANTFTGGVTLNAGTLTLGSASALGGTSGLAFPTASTATLRLNGNPLTVSALNSGFPFIGAAIVESGSATAGTDTLTVINSADNVFTGILRDGAARALALTKGGAGTLTFYGATPNTYTGDTTLLAGRIALSKSGGAIAIAGDFIGDNGLSPDVFTTENNQFDPGSVMYFVNPTGDHVRFELLGTTQTLAGIENSAAGGRGVIQLREQAPAAAISGTSTLILEVPESASYFYNGYLRDTGGILSLVKQGLGTQILGGPNITLTGGITLDGGELVFASSNVGRGAVTINDGCVLELAAPNATDSLGSITINAGGVINDGAAAHNVPQIILNGGAMTSSSPGLLSYGNFVLGGTVNVGGTQTSVISADIRVGSNRDCIFTVNPTGDPSGIDLDITGRIGHLNNVAWSFMTKAGAGTMRLNNPAQVNDIGRLTATEGKMVLNNQMPTFGNGGLIFNGGSVELITATDVSITYGGAMSGSAGTFEKTGPGSLTLTNTGASFAGGFAVGGGLLSLPVRGFNYGDLAVAGGTKLTVAGTSGQFRASGLNLADGSTLEIQNFVSDTGTPPMDVTAADPVTAGTVTLLVSGITGTGVFPLIYYPPSGTVGGAGVGAFSLVTARSVEAGVVDNTTNFSIDLNVTAVNPVTWKGNTGPVWDTAAGNLNWTLESVATAYQDGDLVRFDDSASSFAVTLDEIITPSSVTFDHTADDYTLAGTGAISGTTGLLKTGDGKLTISGSHTYTGGTTVTAGTLELGDGTTSGEVVGGINNDAAVVFNNGASQTFAGVIGGTGTFAKDGAGTLTLTGQPVYAGTTTINGGTLVLQATGTYTYDGGNLFINNGSTLKFIGNRYDMSSKTVSFGSTGGNVLDTSAGLNFVAWSANTYLTNGGTQNSVIGSSGMNVNSGVTAMFNVSRGTDASDLLVSCPIWNAGAISKTGDGIMTLSAASTYGGGTTVDGGTLLVMNTAGSGTGTGTVTVNDTATVGGTGTLTGAVTIAAGGTAAPGTAGIGTLAIGAATLTGTYLCEIDGATADRIDVTGNINATGGTIAFSAIATPSAAEYIIATYSGALDGEPPTITGLPAGYGLDLDTPGQIKLVKSEAGYDTWAALNGLGATNNGLAQDPDADGISNLMEFYLDGDPLASDLSILPDSTLDATYLTLTFKRLDTAEDDVTSQEVQFGANLVDWTSSTIGATSTPADGNGVIVTVTENAEDPDDVVIEVPRAHAADGKLFGRLQIVK